MYVSRIKVICILTQPQQTQYDLGQRFHFLFQLSPLYKLRVLTVLILLKFVRANIAKVM